MIEAVPWTAAPFVPERRTLRSLTAGDATNPCWTSVREALLIEAVDSLHDSSDIDDGLWSRLAAQFSDAELLDLLLLCGWYHAISFTARAARVSPEGWAPRFVDVAPRLVR